LFEEQSFIKDRRESSIYSIQSNVLVTAFFHPRHSMFRRASSISGFHILPALRFCRNSSMPDLMTGLLPAGPAIIF
jgi:hypothetical protein